VGLLTPGSAAARFVAERRTDDAALRKERIHPYALLVALVVYKSGQGIFGDLTWSPCPEIVDALDAGFYSAFKFVKPSNRRYLLGLDVSGSMGSSFLS
jgi:60 kDa SS-A/Ro ribonucleoprotein